MTNNEASIDEHNIASLEGSSKHDAEILTSLNPSNLNDKVKDKPEDCLNNLEKETKSIESITVAKDETKSIAMLKDEAKCLESIALAEDKNECIETRTMDTDETKSI